MSARPSILVVQLGARRGYAVPAALAQEGLLTALYTDLCAGRGPGRLAPLIAACPPLARRINFERRTPPADVLRRTVTFPSWFWAMRRALNGAAEPAERLAALRAAHARASQRMIRKGFGSASHVLTMFGEGLAFQRKAKEQGLVTLTDMNIAPSTEAIVSAEQGRFPDWEGPKMYFGQACAARAGVPPIMEQVLEASDFFLCPSDFVRRDLVENFGVAPERTRLVPYAVHPKWLALTPDPVAGRVLFVGGAELRKGIHILAETARALQARGRTYDICVAGHAHEAIRRRAECSALRFLGRLSATQMEQAFVAADVLALPSLAEGSAGATYEALGAAVPVVATLEAGSLVRDGVEGRIVPSRDPVALADAIEQIVEDRALRSRLSANARMRAAEYTWPRFSERLSAALAERDMEATR